MMDAETSSTKGRLLSIVIPVHNEESVLPESLSAVREHARDLPVDYELVIVDDGSSDSSWQFIQDTFGDAAEKARAIRLSRNFGKEAAISAGVDAARGDAVVVMDADLQHPPEVLREMVDAWLTGEYDIVEGTKRHRGRESAFARHRARCFYSIFRKISGLDLSGASDFKLLDRKAVNSLKQMNETALFFRGMTRWLGFRRKAIELDVPEGVRTGSRWSTGSLASLAVSALVAFSPIPLYFMFLLAFVFFIFSIALGIRALQLWYVGTAVSGFTTVILLNLLMGSFLMAALGIIGVYLGKIYDETKRRPRYLVQESVRSRGAAATREQDVPDGEALET